MNAWARMQGANGAHAHSNNTYNDSFLCKLLIENFTTFMKKVLITYIVVSCKKGCRKNCKLEK